MPEKQTSIERLDDAITVVGVKGWLFLGGSCLLVLLMVLWAFMGTIPISVKGKVLLFDPTNSQNQDPLQIYGFIPFLAAQWVAPGMQIECSLDVLEGENAGLLKGIVKEVSLYPVDAQDPRIQQIPSARLREYLLSDSSLPLTLVVATPTQDAEGRASEFVWTSGRQAKNPPPIGHDRNNDDHPGAGKAPLLHYPLVEEVVNLGRRIADTPTVLQMEACECGPASLAMIFGYYELYIPLEKLRIECGASRDGSSAANLLKTGIKYGFDVKAYRYSAEELKEIEFPAIILWGPAHYVVLEGFAKNSVYINDPGTGKKKVPYEIFEKIYGQVVLTLTKTSQFQKGGEKTTPFPLKIAGCFKNTTHSLPLLLLTSACLLLPGFAFPAFLLVFIDVYFSKFHMPWKEGFSGFVLLAALFSGLLVWAQLYYLNRLNTKISIRLSSGLLWRLLKLPVNFFENRNVGSIPQFILFSQEVAQILTGSVCVLLSHLLFFVFFGLAMFAYNSEIALIGIGVGLLNLASAVWVYYWKSDSQSLTQVFQAMRLGISSFALSNIDSIKIGGGESNFFSIWAAYHTKSLNHQQKMERRHLVFEILPLFFQMLAWAALIGIGSIRIIEGALSAGELMALGVLQMSFLVPITKLVRLSPTILQLKQAFQRLEDISTASLDPVYQNPKDAGQTDGKLAGLLEFQNVVFSYSSFAKPILNQISFAIEPGQITALSARNGSGRSTLMKLAAGIYHPNSGQILYDKIPLDRLSSDLFRNSIGYVDQEIFLFTGTVRDNLTLWNSDVSDSTLYEAAQDAFIHEKISLLPDGYDSTLAQGGNNFGLQEKQQLQLARALLYKPTFLLLDKALNHLETELQTKILRRIREKKITVLIVEDDPSLLRCCDTIIVLDDNGAITQRGTPQQLNSEPGLYHQLMESQ